MLRTLEGSALCSVLADRVKEYFKDEENRKKFEIWYVWKRKTAPGVLPVLRMTIVP